MMNEGGDFLMKLKEQAIKRLEELKPEALARIYDLITELKRPDQAKKRPIPTI